MQKGTKVLSNFRKNFAEKWDIFHKMSCIFAKPKTGSFAKSEIFVYLREFSGKFETVQMGYYGAGGKLFNEKTRSKKSRDTFPLTLGKRDE